MPQNLLEAERQARLASLPPAAEASLADFTSSLSTAAEACQKLEYEELPAAELLERAVQGRMITYASPDSTYAVTKRLIEAAQSSIIIGIYDFSADYIKELLLRAIQRGVRVSLLLDLNGRQGEEPIFSQLHNRGATTVRAPSCRGRGLRPPFEHAHEKIIVVDGEWTMIQSGNWSENSAPFNEGDGVVLGEWVAGNRDMGLAIQSPEFADFFTRLIQSDMALELGQAEAEALLSDGAPAAGDLLTTFSENEIFAEAPPLVPEELFPSRTFPMGAPVRIRPVLTPDNYMEVVPEFLRSAQRSIWIEQQYIRAHQETIRILLDAIRDARANSTAPNFDIRIIVAPRDAGVPRMLTDLANDYDLHAPGNIRLLSRRYFEHCHNKLIVVDGRRVLVGSQNWSTTAVTENREASLLVTHQGVASYFARIFDADWRMSEPQGDADAEGAGDATARQLFSSPAFASGLV